MPANQQIINYGNTANDGTGDPLRTAFIKTDQNFANIWNAGPVGSNITITNNTVGVTNTNGNLVLAPNGVGIIQTRNHVQPWLTNTYDLGTANLKYRNIYGNALYANAMSLTGDVTIGGNLTVEGDTIQIGNITTETLTVQLANSAANGTSANGSGITVGANDDIATILYNSTSNVWTMNIGVTSTGNVTAPYFIGNGALLTGITSYSNTNATSLLASFGSNTISTTGNITAGYFIGNGSQLTGVTSYTNANAVSYGESGWAGNIIPSGNAVYSLGNATNQWSDLYVSNATIYMNNVPISLGAGNVLTVNGEAVLSNDSNTSISTTGNVSAEILTANIAVNIGTGAIGIGDDNYLVVETLVPGGFRPSNDDTYNLGNVSHRWSEVHANVFYGNGSQLTGLSFTSISNDGSIVDIVVPNGDVTITADSTQTWTFDTTGNLTLPNNGSIIVDGGDGVIGPVSDDLVIAWDNEEIRLVSVQGSIEMQADNAFRVQTNYDGGTDTYLSRWEFNQDEIVNITGSSAIVTEAGNLTLSGGRDGIASGNVSVVAVNNGVAVNTWTFGTDSVLTTPGGISINGDITGPGSLEIQAAPGGNAYVNLDDISDSYIGAAANLSLLTDSDNREWIFDTTGTLTTPGDITVGGDITGRAAANVLVLKAQPTTNTYIQLNSIVDSTIQTFANLDIVTDSSNTARTFTFGTDGVLTTPGNIATDWLNIGNVGNIATLEADVSLTIVADASGSAPFWVFNSDGNLQVPGSINGDNNGPLLIDGIGSGEGYISLPNTAFGGEQIRIVNQFSLGNGISLTTGGGEWHFADSGNLFAPGSVTAQNFIGNISITGNVTGTSANVDLVAGSYTWSFDNTGVATFPGNISVTGNVITPNLPAFRVYGNGVTNVSTTTNTTGVLNGNNWAVDYNQGSYLNSTTGTFTAPVSGLYQVNLVARVANNSGSASQAIVYKNYGTANTTQVMWESAANCTVNHFGVSTVSKLAVGDTLSLVVTIGQLTFDSNDSWSVAFLG